MLKKILFISLLTLNLSHASAQENNDLDNNNDFFNCYACNKEKNKNNNNKQHKHNSKKTEKKGFFRKSMNYSSSIPKFIFKNSF